MPRYLSFFVAILALTLFAGNPVTYAEDQPELTKREKRIVKRIAKKQAQKKIDATLPLDSDGLAAGAVGTPEIADGAVTFEKLSQSVVLSFLSAYVDKDGNLQAGTPGTTATRQGVGLYFVTFPIPVDKCYSVGQVSYLDALSGAGDTTNALLRTFTDQVGFGPNAVRVSTSQVSASGISDADKSFSLMVFCL